ncbi:MAG: hypothetical protein PARBA_03703 [Parabacteroides sp.]
MVKIRILLVCAICSTLGILLYWLSKESLCDSLLTGLTGTECSVVSFPVD